MKRDKSIEIEVKRVPTERKGLTETERDKQSYKESLITTGRNLNEISHLNNVTTDTDVYKNATSRQASGKLSKTIATPKTNRLNLNSLNSRINKNRLKLPKIPEPKQQKLELESKKYVVQQELNKVIRQTNTIDDNYKRNIEVTKYLNTSQNSVLDNELNKSYASEKSNEHTLLNNNSSSQVDVKNKFRI